MSDRRARYLLIVFGLLFLTLIGYLTHMEIYYSKEYTESASNPRNYELDRKVIRGTIYDRNGTKLAYSELVEEDVITTDENGEEIPTTIKKIVRRYPYDNLYTGVVGYVTSDYSSRTLIEDSYNSTLLDTDIVTKISDEISGDSVSGKSIRLTLDHELQTVASEAMGSYNGAVVAMNPKTGEIYAMVSKPSLDANNITIDESDEQEDAILYSRPLQIPYPPGSTYKIITAAAIIEEGLQDEIYSDTTGKFVIESADGNPENDFVCRNSSGSIYYDTDLAKGFRVSSNAYFSHMSIQLGQIKVQDTAKKFLLNSDLNESIGFDTPVASSKFQKGSMTDAEIALASIGQGQTEMTPLHMALVGATIANDGIMPKPYLVSHIGSISSSSASNGKRIISSETAKQLKDLMLDATQNGTGTSAKIEGIEVCGKTGTSENNITANGGYDADKTHALYVGFAPYDDPEIAICVVLEYAGFGGSKAAPVAKRVMETYFSR